MKNIKYLIFITIVMFLGINNVSAKTYNYKYNDTFEINNTPQISMFAANENDGYYGGDTSCQGIFGSKNDPESLRSLIDEILFYPKLIVPAIVIGFGVLDFVKAVTSSSEENMKKATKTFAKRVIIGMCIFLVPIIMDALMYLADIVWNGSFTTCGI